MAVYDNIWQKRWFIPVWVLQWGISLWYLVTNILNLYVLDRNRREGHRLARDAQFAGWCVYFILVSLLTVFANAAECYLFARRALSPRSSCPLARRASSSGSAILPILTLLTVLVQLGLGARFTYKWRNGTLALHQAAAGASKGKNPRHLEGDI
ncbi:uncharacterized protein PG998_004784 [Apiospora kogelbergensis]|uniref:uncharacterized protein n=1 Tax=Apiospora kogelbergensis TaxID=1337665 RepID=UPI00312E5A17